MTEKLLPDTISPSPLVPPSLTPLPASLDERLLLSATTRWRAASGGLGELLNNAPATPDKQRWKTYWDARAPGTPLSRRDRAIELYRDHLEAVIQAAFARQRLTAEQAQPLLALLDSTTTDLRLKGQPLRTERLTLVSSDYTKVSYPAAWVISLGDKDPSPHWLYLPSHAEPIQAFEKRSLMESWLSRQSLVPTETSVEDIGFEFRFRTPMLAVGMTDLLLHLQQPASGKHAAEFTLPPAVETGSHDDQPAMFGTLYADVPWTLRQTALSTQRAALERYLGDDLESERQKKLADELSVLEAAVQSADQAATALLYRERLLDTTTINREFTALYNAHKAGLRAEIEVQRALEQLNEYEHRLINNLLDGAALNTGAKVWSLTLTIITGDPTQRTTHDLNGPWLIESADASVLLHWPGTGGGLQRFVNLRAIEREVFKIQEQDDRLTLSLKPINHDPLHYSLNQLIDVFEESAAKIRQRYTEDSQATQRAVELEQCRRDTLAGLQVPVNAARQLVFSQRLEQNRSATLANQLPEWLGQNTESGELKPLIQAWITAMQRSHEQLEIVLMPRKDFTRERLYARLKKDFAIKGDFQVQLDLPDSVAWQKESFPAPGAPGTPQKLTLIPSTRRSKMSLEDLAQLNIDDTPSMNLEPLMLRLSFMKVEVSSANAAERQALNSGITLPWLRKVLPELDLPQAYEQLIRKVFMGAADEAAFVREHRRECLLEPWRLILKLQGETARLQKQISADELRILKIAIDADTPQAWTVDGKRIVLWPARLGVGGKDTPDEGPVTLAGVIFIEEQVSGMTLLYLPDSPDGQFLRRYDNLETARKALYNLCLRDEMLNYLAGRALQGSVQAHASRINQAMLKHFDAIIAVGTRWPATTSLAAHQLDSHMGRLIEAHRATSRSNVDLYLERYALQGPRVFNYLKMALGLVPFVGTAIALYDAWNSANLAVSAFVRGKVGDGLAETESMLLCLIDAAMDILPSVSINTAQAARSATGLRQLKAMNAQAAMQSSSLNDARRVIQRFAGYEYEKPLSLADLQPGSRGMYRNVYRHAEGDFIVRQGRIFEVERSKDSRNWRLKGTTQKTYKQPIALDEAGHWDTYYGVHGVAFEGGGLGGGNVLGYLADTLDPVWPRAIRERLPRWWVDESFRRLHALTQAADNLAPQIDARVKQTEVHLAAYENDRRSATLRQQAETACIADIDMARLYHQTLVDLFPLTHGNKRRVLLDFQSDAALILSDRYKKRVFFANHSVEPLLDSIDELMKKLEATPLSNLSLKLQVLAEVRKLRIELIEGFDNIEAHMRELNHWYQRITTSADKAQLTPDVTMLNGRLTEGTLLNVRACNLLEVVTRYDAGTDLSWFFLQGQMRASRERVERALVSQFSLSEVSATKAQRNRILQDCIEHYSEFRRGMNAWTASYPQHFHLESVPPFMEALAKLSERARKALDLPAPSTKPGQISKKVFVTESDELLIGVEHLEKTTQRYRYTLTGKGGYTEVWEKGADGKSRLLNPPPAPSHTQHRNLDSLLAEARQRLQSQDAYLAKIESYASQDMLPVDLEHMMLKEADELSRRAQGIEALAPQDALVQQLRDKATELTATGRTLRTRQTLLSKKPTDGMLDDLLKHDAVEIRKTSLIKNLGKRRDGRNDFMQEYEIWDKTQTPAKVLWYAHFHYSRAAPDFDGFEKGHLKLPEHRFLTHADNADLPYADIGKRSAVLPYFEKV
ncbi:dermonecrotic toxin domain-containing protein [Pseudomonas sp. SDO55104_S430]